MTLIRPIRDHVIVEAMYFGDQKTKSGLIILDDDGKSEGVRARWAKVWAVGPNQQDVEPGQWILIEHGRWTRSFKFTDDEGNLKLLRRVDVEAIMGYSDEEPLEASGVKN
jgi:co-chaperonin GroES (HSP10)